MRANFRALLALALALPALLALLVHHNHNREGPLAVPRVHAPETDPEEPRCFLKPDAGLCKAAFERYYYDAPSQSCKTFTWGGCAGVVPFDNMTECEKACVPRASPAASPTPTAPKDWSGKRLFILNKHANDSRLCIISGSKALSTVTGTVWPDQVWRLERHAGYDVGFMIVNDYFIKYRVALSSGTKRLFAFNGRIWPDQMWAFSEFEDGWFVIENMFFKGYKIARVGRGPSGMVAYRGDDIEDNMLWKLEEVA